MKAIAIILIIVGLFLSIFSGVRYFTKEKVVDVGKLEITKEKPRSISWSPIAGVALLVAGGVMYFAAVKRGG